MLKILGIIPARGGSKGIPRKNLIDVAGKPLLYYTFTEALKSTYLDRIVLSTDNEEIAEYARSFGIDVPFIRPPHLANDDAPMFSVVEHALNWLKKNENYWPDALMILHPTSPLRTAQHIDGAIMEFEKKNVDTLVSVSEPLEHPMEMVYFENTKMKFALERKETSGIRQEYRKYCFLNGAIYISKIDTLLEQKTLLSGSIAPYLIDTIDSIDIDTTADLVIADCLLKRRHTATQKKSSC